MKVGGLALVIFCVFIFSADASYNRPNVPCEIQYWPLPRSIHRGTNYSLIDPNNLQIITEYSNGTIVPEQVTAKIEKIVEIHKKNFFQYGKNSPANRINANTITRLYIQLSESYENVRFHWIKL